MPYQQSSLATTKIVLFFFLGGCSGLQGKNTTPQKPKTVTEIRYSRCRDLAATIASFQLKAAKASDHALVDLITETENNTKKLRDDLKKSRSLGHKKKRERLSQQLEQVQLLMNQLKLEQNRSDHLRDLLEIARPRIIRSCSTHLSQEEITCLEGINFEDVEMPWGGQFNGLQQAAKRISACIKRDRFLAIFSPKVASTHK